MSTGPVETRSTRWKIQPSLPDGQCLFHSLDPGCDALHLRLSVIENLRAESALTGDFGFEYLDEADALENDTALYGGHTAIVMFSKMRGVRVLIHNTRNLDLPPAEATHPEVPATATIVRIAYNGVNHYDAVVPRDKPLTPKHPLQESAGGEEADVEHSTSRPKRPFRKMRFLPPQQSCHAPKMARTGKSPSSMKSIECTTCNETSEEAKSSAARTHAGAVKAPKPVAKPPPRRRRYSTKRPAQPPYKLSIYEEVCKAKLRYPSKHPHAELETELDIIVSSLRAFPTIPPGRSDVRVEDGERWPAVFCAFQNCMWEQMDGSEEDLVAHLQEAHREELKPAAELLPMSLDESAALRSVYNEAIAEILRGQVPIAGPSLDRTALHAYAKATEEDKVEALICFCCGCIHTHIKQDADKNDIDWVWPVEISSSGDTLMFGMALNAASQLIGMQTFLDKYGHVDGYANIGITGELNEWRSAVYDYHKNEFVEFICCPEDHKCSADLNHHQSHIICEECQVPVCRQCQAHLKKGKLSPLSLANDMWTGFAPAVLYDERVTVMEMVCASPCLTTLLCFSMETRYRNDHLLDEKAHMARHRVGARGNALTFPLPWEQLIDTLQRFVAQEEDADGEEGHEKTQSLPWTGAVGTSSSS